MAETCSPDGKDVAFIVLLHGVFEDVIGIGCPSVGDVKFNASTWEEDTIEFGEKFCNIGLVAVGKDWDNLRTRHLNKLYVRGSNVSFEGSR